MKSIERIPLIGEADDDLNIIEAVNAVNFILSWLTADQLPRYVQIELAAISQTKSVRPHLLNVDAIAKDTCLDKSTVQILLRSRLEKQGWVEKNRNDYIITSEGIKHAEMMDQRIREKIVKYFKEIPKAYQVDLYNAMRLIVIGMTDLDEMRDLSDLVIITKRFEYMNEVRMFKRTYYASRANFLKAVNDAGRLTCSAYCSEYVPYKSRQNVKFLMLRLIKKGYLKYVGKLERGAMTIHGDLVITKSGKKFLNEVTGRAQKKYENMNDLPYDAENIKLIRAGLEAIAEIGMVGIRQRWYEVRK